MSKAIMRFTRSKYKFVNGDQAVSVKYCIEEHHIIFEIIIDPHRGFEYTTYMILNESGKFIANHWYTESKYIPEKELYNRLIGSAIQKNKFIDTHSLWDVKPSNDVVAICHSLWPHDIIITND